MSRALFFLSCTLAASPALAQEPEAPTATAPATVRLTADEAVTRALAASPRLARLGALEAAAEAQRARRPRGATAADRSQRRATRDVPTSPS